MMKSIVLHKVLLTLISALVFLSQGCSKKEVALPVEEEVTTPPVTVGTDSLKIYKPKEFEGMDYNDKGSKWSYSRSRQSEHFIVFWGASYGKNDPNANTVPEEYRVDIDDLLAKAEQFYALNVGTLKFAERKVNRSNLDKYKMMIFVHYTTEWMAYGGGYDDTIGALWINPATCKPVGSVIAHEIGHSFQYQVFADLKGGHGFRYGYGGTSGNGFWEQTAQWQAYQTYPAQAFSGADFPVYTENYHRHIHHEKYRYASYFIHWYWTSKHGIDMIGRIWREALKPEDPVQAYMRITGIDVKQFNNEIYDAAAHFVTWDLNSIREYGKNYIGKLTTKFTRQSNGSLRVAYDRCPGTTGYNVIPLEVPAAGTKVSVAFKGLPNAAGFNPVDASRAGWRYGYVALLKDGTRVYGDRTEGTENTVAFTVPANCSNLWFVVTGAPSVYQPHAWDDDDSNDKQWPYEIKIQGTTATGYNEVSSQPKDIALNYDLSFPADATGYSGTQVSVNAAQLGEALAIPSADLAGLMSSGKIKFYAVEPNGSLNPNNTATGYGHWFTPAGAVTNWGASAGLFSEFNASTITFSIGQYPGALAAGKKYTIKQALVYTYEGAKTVQATFTFNVNVK
ncbi:DUF4859 domain-containing protein [Sphingobacterium multivorum]|uniref:DUF4859 domain-containing protein n=2 Tax=Sphingobacterium multivorum TaxID=28454 RepID=A0A654CQ78_SPHMU|nr:DUF4859 domain-containing protein [Sphingobacterium multivorum]VXC95578.1 conserved exported hypothetical protein [Sphingobacterium multivorum]